jgi:uncharacterized protein
MLVEFRVKNFRSIRSEQCLSLVASKDKALADTNLIGTGIRSLPQLIRSSVIYGANASGKSNLIRALAFMKEVIATSATKIREGQKFNHQPFKLDKKSGNQPTEFEITFIDRGIRYQYGFTILPDRIAEEWLIVYKTAKPQVWFNRAINAENGKDEYKFGTHLTGERKLWEKSTRTNALFLSKAVDLNSEKLRPIYLWIVEKLKIVASGQQPVNDFSIECAQTDEGKDEILRFLAAADLSIADLSFEKRKVTQVGLHLGMEKDQLPTHDYRQFEAQIPLFEHKAQDGTASFEIPEESAGTQRIFAFAGPVIDVLKRGSILVVDELDGSLHPLMVRFLISTFQSSETNKNGAQLIFTTHDTSALNVDIFRRDQIWFIEKDRAQSSQLYPLSDFSPRKNEAIERGYLMGRYGALPFLTEFRF